jgi:cbb3-type cytochrome oxidase subunit 3
MLWDSDRSVLKSFLVMGMYLVLVSLWVWARARALGAIEVDRKE